MAGMAKLSQEEMDEVIRRSVKKDDGIDIRYLDEEVEALVAPFKPWYKSLQVAEREVFRVNTFRVSVADIEISYEECVRDSRIVAPPFLVSETTGRVSNECRKIERLEIHLASRVKGIDLKTFDPIEVDLDDPTMEKIYRACEQMPRLRTLRVKIYNQGKLSTLSLFKAVTWTSASGFRGSESYACITFSSDLEP